MIPLLARYWIYSCLINRLIQYCTCIGKTGTRDEAKNDNPTLGEPTVPKHHVSPKILCLGGLQCFNLLKCIKDNFVHEIIIAILKLYKLLSQFGTYHPYTDANNTLVFGRTEYYRWVRRATGCYFINIALNLLIYKEVISKFEKRSAFLGMNENYPTSLLVTVPGTVYRVILCPVRFVGYHPRLAVWSRFDVWYKTTRVVNSLASSERARRCWLVSTMTKRLNFEYSCPLAASSCEELVAREPGLAGFDRVNLWIS